MCVLYKCRMSKTGPLGFRLEPDEKAALERAAASESRSLSSMMRKILRDWLKQHAWLKSQS